MSSYIVQFKTIDRIVSLIERIRRETSSQIKIPFGDNAETKFGKKLLKLNIKATGQRYDTNIEKTQKDFEVFADKYIFNPKNGITNIIQQFKALNCFLYQCLEGNVPKIKLYKELRELQNHVSYKIINELPEYDKAEWG